jgi:hypothetical protein
MGGGNTSQNYRSTDYERADIARHASSIGAAGEHITCADLLLNGYRAFQAGEGLPYDLVVEHRAKLIRVTVKSTLKPRPRPGRPNSADCYQYQIGQRKRDHTGKTSARAYTAELVDIVAVVALDMRWVAYLWIGDCPTILHLEAPHGQARSSKFGPTTMGLRRFSDLQMGDAITRLMAGWRTDV